MISLCVLVAAALSACGFDADPQESSNNRPAAPAGEVLTAEQRAYLDALSKIDPGLVSDQERALDRVANICLDIAMGQFSDEQLAERVANRLSGGNVKIDLAQAAEVITLAKEYAC